MFAGAGISQNGALFSYHANWEAPGRWVVEILTKKHRLIFRPLEKLQIQRIGSITAEEFLIDTRLDVNFKPGLFLQVEHFLMQKKGVLLRIQEQLKNLEYYKKINFGK